MSKKTIINADGSKTETTVVEIMGHNIMVCALEFNDGSFFSGSSELKSKEESDMDDCIETCFSKIQFSASVSELKKNWRI